LEACRLVTVEHATRLDEKYSVHPAIHDFFYRTVTNPEPVHDAVRAHLESLAEQPGRRGTITDPEVLSLFEELIYHAIQSGRIEEAFDVFTGKLGAYDLLGRQLGAYSHGRSITMLFFPDTSKLLEDMDLQSLKSLTPAKQVWLLDAYAGFVSNLGQLHLALRLYTRATEIAREVSYNEYSARGLQGMTTTYRLLGQLRNAENSIQAVVKALQEMRDSGKESDEFWREEMLFKTHIYFAWIHVLRGNLAAARDEFETARTIFKEEGNVEVPHDYGWGTEYVGMLARVGNISAAKQRAAINLSYCQREHRLTRLVPRNHLILGEIGISERDTASTHWHLRQALDWGTRNADEEVIAWSHLVRAKLALSEGSYADVIRATKDGLQIAEECSYGLYWIDLQIVQALGYLHLGDASVAERCVLLALRGYSSADGRLQFLGAEDPECGYAWGIGDGLHVLGQILAQQGKTQEAKVAFQRALTIRNSIDDPRKSETLIAMEHLA